MTEEVGYESDFYFCYESMAVVYKVKGSKYKILSNIFGNTKGFGEDTHVNKDNYKLVLKRWHGNNGKHLEVRNIPSYDIKAINKALEMYNGDTPTLS